MLLSCKKEIIKYGPIVFILFLVDIITKYIFTNKSYFDGFLISIKYVQNKGSAFSLFSGVELYNIIIILLSIIVLTVLFYNFKSFSKNKIYLYSILLLICGILGNLYDRIVFGFVRDFISLKYLFVFNIADLYLTLGIILILYYELQESKFINFKK